MRFSIFASCLCIACIFAGSVAFGAEEEIPNKIVLSNLVARSFPELTDEMTTVAVELLVKFSPDFADRVAANGAFARSDVGLLRSELLRCARLHYACEPVGFDARRGGLNTLETVIGDMGQLHDAPAHGVPESWSWANAPRLGLANHPGECTQFVAWGQIYEAKSGNHASNTRVQVKDLEAFYLGAKDGRWHMLQAAASLTGGKLNGASYAEDFAGNANKPADIRREPDGSVSVKLEKDRNFHFYPAKRVNVDPADIAGIFATARARTVVDDPSLPDDRAQARYLMGMGGDYWLEGAAWDHLKSNNDAAIGRFKFVTPAWQSFNMTTLSGSVLRRNPPPLNGR